MDDTKLLFRSRKDRLDCTGKAGEIVAASDQYVLDASVLQLIADCRP